MPLSPTKIVEVREAARKEILAKVSSQIDKNLLVNFEPGSEKAVEIPWTDFQDILAKNTLIPIVFDDIVSYAKQEYEKEGWLVETAQLHWKRGEKALQFRARKEEDASIPAEILKAIQE